MPYSIHWEDTGAYVVLRGVLPNEELEEMNNTLIRQVQDRDCSYQIFNLLEVQDMPINEVDTVDIAADDLAVSRSITDLLVAFVVRDKRIRAVVEKYIQISWNLNSTWHFRIFDNEATARDWVELYPQKDMA